jgi:hypothetical protein
VLITAAVKVVQGSISGQRWFTMSPVLKSDARLDTTLLTGNLMTPPPTHTHCCLLAVSLQAIAPASHTASASTSTLCKVLTWHLGRIWQEATAAGAKPCLMHQADWLAYLLHGARTCVCNLAASRQQPWMFGLTEQVLQRAITCLHC